MLSTRHPALIYWGSDLVCLYNDAFAACLGPEKHPSVLGMPAAQAWPEVLPAIAPELRQVLAGGESTWQENRLIPIERHGQLEEVYWTYSFAPIHDAAAPNGVGGVLTLITETTQAVVAQQESEARYRTLFESMDQGFCVLELAFDAVQKVTDGWYIETNRAFEQQTGLKNAVGRTIRELIPDVEPFWLEAYGKVALTGKPVRLVEHVQSLGRWFDVYAFRIDHPRQHHVGVRFSDITERKQAEEALRQSEERLRSAFQIKTVGVMFWDKGFGLTDMNDAFLEMTGFTRAEALGKTWQELTPPEFYPPSLKAVAEVTTHGETTPYEKQYFRKDGSRWWGLFAARKVGDEVVEFVLDVTERREAEAAVRIAKDAAERAQAEAEEANQAKSRFLAAASHDLRQPVMAAGLYMGLLQSRVGDVEARELIDKMSLSLEGLRGMLNGLLEMARLEAGVLEPKLEALALNDLLQRLGAEFAGPAQTSGLELQVATTDLAVRSDRLLLELILRNLLSNAVKYTERGGVTVECMREDGCIRIEVTDTGPGIPPEQLGCVFEDFVQIGEENRSLGFGIGLATVRRAADLLGHKVDVRSELGNGSTFSVWVPESGNINQFIEPSGRIDTAPLPPFAALVVEDEWLIAAALCMALEDWGLTATAAHSVAEAQAAVAAGRFDLVISDYQLPDGNGFDAIAAARTGGAKAAVLLTGDTRPDTLRRAHEAGLRLLTKPVEMNDLRVVVRDLTTLHGSA